MATKKKTTTKNKTKSPLWNAAFNAAITGLSSMAALDNSGILDDVEQVSMAAEVVKRAENIADMTQLRLG